MFFNLVKLSSVTEIALATSVHERTPTLSLPAITSDNLLPCSYYKHFEIARGAEIPWPMDQPLI